MKDRIKAVRKAAKLTQVQFGERLGVKGNTVTGYETGLRNPTDAVVKAICREFDVNENWLRYGYGEMFATSPTDVVGEVADKLGLNEFEQLILNAYVKLPKQLRDAFCAGMRDGLFRGDPVLSIKKAASADAEAGNNLTVAQAIARSGDRAEVNQVSKEEEDAVLPPKYTGDM